MIKKYSDSVNSAVVRKNGIFEIQINLTRRCLFHSEKITALNPLCQCQRLELLTEGLSSPISPLHDLFLLLSTRGSPPLRLVSSADESTRGCCRSDSPQRLHPHLAQSAHAELTQPKLLLDPQIGRLRHLRPLPIDLPRLLALHLLAELRHFG